MTNLVFSHTDDERLSVLKASFYTLSTIDISQYSIKAETLAEVEKYYDMFEKIKEFDNIIKKEKEQDNKALTNSYDKANVYLTHYFQAMLMAIERGELPISISEEYGFVYPFNVPDFSNKENLLQVARKLFEDDDRRVGNGGKYFANPSIGSVKVWVEKFAEAYDKVQNVYNIKRGKIENIGKIRESADSLIFEVHQAINDYHTEISFKEKFGIFKKYGMRIQQRVEVEEFDSPKQEAAGNSNQLSFDLFW